jgi:hypothetical protein
MFAVDVEPVLAVSAEHVVRDLVRRLLGRLVRFQTTKRVLHLRVQGLKRLRRFQFCSNQTK